MRDTPRGKSTLKKNRLQIYHRMHDRDISAYGYALYIFDRVGFFAQLHRSRASAIVAADSTDARDAANLFSPSLEISDDVRALAPFSSSGGAVPARARVKGDLSKRTSPAHLAVYF